MRVGVCMCACGCVGGCDMVYGCGRYEGEQDENSDYTCAYVSLLIIFECVSYCLFYSAYL